MELCGFNLRFLVCFLELCLRARIKLQLASCFSITPLLYHCAMNFTFDVVSLCYTLFGVSHFAQPYAPMPIYEVQDIDWSGSLVDNMQLDPLEPSPASDSPGESYREFIYAQCHQAMDSHSPSGWKS